MEELNLAGLTKDQIRYLSAIAEFLRVTRKLQTKKKRSKTPQAKVWKDMKLRVPFPLTREHIYEDL